MDNLENGKSLKSYKTISSILITLAVIVYVVVTGILLFWLVDSLTLENANDVSLNVAFFLIFGVIMVGGIGYFISLIFTVIGLIMSVIYRKYGVRKNRLVFFIVMTVLSIVTEVVFLTFALLA